ncbi:MAG: Sua5/YciO/YrdC/YwlC family protein [Terriglobales bacterium]
MQASELENRLAIVVSGVVQGVGFRPFVYALARRNDLSGFVRNNSGSVQIEVQGAQVSLAEFLRDLKEQAPALSEIARIESSKIAVKPEFGFRIDESLSSLTGQKLLPPDAATCNECLQELFDPENRRFRYPFINCTNCGPRFTIIASLPYDRQCTTMASFVMCGLCRREYEDPNDRRFHAEPIACSSCGPELTWQTGDARFSGEEALQQALRHLSRGEIAAVKGLGGFHLVCDAEDDQAIEKLRTRKRRAKKPFALMMADLEMVRKHCALSAQEELALLHPSRPIVLLEKLAQSPLPEQIAPGCGRLGVMLPYTPLHHLLMFEFKKPIIATSANLSEEPIVIDNQEARERLAELADGFLDHNRDIR